MLQAAARGYAAHDKAGGGGQSTGQTSLKTSRETHFSPFPELILADMPTHHQLLLRKLRVAQEDLLP